MIFLTFLQTIHAQETPQGLQHNSPYAAMQTVGLSDVHWNDGFWGRKFDVCSATMVPHIWSLFNNPEYSHAYNNFKIAAGLMEGRHHGAKFSDGDFYKWMEAAVYVYALTQDELIDRQLDEIISVIAKAQRGDGYIHTPVLIAQRNHEATQEWNSQLHFETYNMGHLFTTAAAHNRATGKRSLLDVAVKAGHYLNQVSLDNPAQLASITICPSHYMGVIDLYRVTEDDFFLQLAKRLIDIRPMNQNGTDQNQDRIPFRQQTEAVGHAVRGNYLYAGVADIYLETGDETLLPALHSIWQDVTQKKLYVTGSTGALYDGASPDGSRDHSAIQLVHQAYGRPYQLPNITAYNETCATIGFGLWAWRMLRITGQATYADMLELAMYNGMLSGISLEGTHYFYTNPLRVVSGLPFDLRWSGERHAYFGSFCCPPNVVRMIAGMHRYAYGVSDNTVWVNMYGANELETTLPGGEYIHLKQYTNYPWDGKIELEILYEGDYTLMLRIPGWTHGASLRINGERVDTELRPGAYHAVQESWHLHDEIELDLPMNIQLIEANPMVEETRNQVAIQRGPMVYCLESNDLPDGVSISDIALQPNTDRMALGASDKLDGATVIEGTILADSHEDWGGKLYREYRRDAQEEIKTRFIPYYTWGNRGPSEMSVWLPVR